MKTSITRFLALALLLTFSASQSFAENMKIYNFDESIGKRGNMEVYFPPNHDKTKPVPCIILFHGGAWVSGNLNSFRPQAAYFAKRGVVAITANYKLAGKGKDANGGRPKHDITNISAQRAIRWIRANADELGIDPKRIVAGGGSAGGQTALGATMRTDIAHPDDDASIDTSVLAYLLFNPALGGRTGNPLKYGFEAKDLPPMIAFFGTSDGYLPPYKAFHEEAMAAGAPRMELWYAHFEGHAFFKDQPWLDLCKIKADEFLVSLGILEGTSPLSPPASGETLSLEYMPELSEEVLATEVFVFKKSACLSTCTKKKREGWQQKATKTTVREALTMTTKGGGAINLCQHCAKEILK